MLQKELVLNGLNTPLSKACQISIDANVFSQCCNIFVDILEPMLISFQWSDSIEIYLPNMINNMKNNMLEVAAQSQVCYLSID